MLITMHVMTYKWGYNVLSDFVKNIIDTLFLRHYSTAAIRLRGNLYAAQGYVLSSPISRIHRYAAGHARN